AKLSDWMALAGRKVILWPDRDEPGRRYARDVAALAAAAGAASVAIVEVPAEWPGGWDIADPLPGGADSDALAELLQSAISWPPPEPNEPGGEVDAAGAEKTKPLLVIDDGDLPATVRRLRDLLAADGNLYDRDTPVKLVQPASCDAMIAKL